MAVFHSHGAKNGRVARLLLRAMRGSGQLARDRRGSVALLTAISMTGILGVGALAVDLTRVYLSQTDSQRIADQASLAAAYAYSQSSSTTSVAVAAGQSMATVNGSGSDTITTTIVNSPSGDGNMAAKVVVQSPLTLSPFGWLASLQQGASASALPTTTVSATSYSEIKTTTTTNTACIIALNSGGVTAGGGTSAAANGCTIASGGSVTASGGASILAKKITAVGSVSKSGGASITTSPTANQIVTGASAPTDPFALAGIFARIPTVAALTFPTSVGSAPTGGSDKTCSGTSSTLTIASGSYGTVSTGWNPSCTTINFSGGSETDIGGSGLSLSGSSVTLNFAAGTYKIKGITVNGGTTVTINTTGTVVFDIWNGINVQSTLTVNGSATYNIQGGVTVGGGSTVTFGAGNYTIAGGITTSGGSKLTFGGASSSSAGFVVTSGNSKGNALETGGGGSFTLGSYTNVDLNGGAVLYGNVTLGAGNYTINGALDASQGGGNSFTGSGVSIVAAGAIKFGAGYNAVTVSAPSAIGATTGGTLATIAFASQSTSASEVNAGASNTQVLGTVYTPYAALSLNGAGNLSGGGGCMEIVASSVSLGGGSHISTTCSSLGTTTGSTTVALVQ